VLVIDNLPEGSFTLEIRNTCAPEKNTRLSGLYTSGGGFFTQCEAEGFRRITFFLDRPDVMAEYSVLIRANKAAYPVLLSNGNLVEEGELDNGRHFARWHDPFPKPSYLFALVAARLVAREQRVRSRSGKDHLLQVWVREGDLDKTERAMESLVASVVWDEARFGLPLDLERFMIVAVGDFNMGAMENKGLNLFNTKYVLANPATATDDDYAAIESVVGHEYFHNWTGNRITCRDWFQLSLKEGLTVFRDQEFSMDMVASPTARAVRRIEAVRDAAPGAVPRGRRGDGASGAARQLRRDQQLLHADDLREGRRGRAHDAVAGGPRGLRARHHALLPAPRRPGRDLRRLRPGDRRRQPGSELARACRSSSAGTARRARRGWRRAAGTTRRRAPSPSASSSRRGRRPARRRASPSSFRWRSACWRATAGRCGFASRTSPRPRRDEPDAGARRAPRPSSPSSTSTSRRCSPCCAASRRRSACSTASATPSS
jgi:hypothetical protein